MTKQSKLSKRALLVAGMHRSGTSAVARVINLLGADLPKELTPAHPERNPLGYWEPRRIVELHDELLTCAGLSWNDISPIPDSWFDSALVHRFADSLLAALHEDFEDSSFFVLKDPRLCRLLPLWLSVLPRFEAEAAIIIPFRNPLEVASSLRVRDDLPPNKSLLLWLRYILDVERASRHHPRVFLAYEDLLTDWRQTIERLGAALGLSWPRASHHVSTKIDAFLSDEQRHHTVRAEVVESRRDIVRWVKTVFAGLLAASRDDRILQEAFDEVRGEFDTADLAYGPLLASREAELDQLRGQRDRLASERTQLERERQQMVAEHLARIDAFATDLREERRERRELVELVTSQGKELDHIRVSLDSLTRDLSHIQFALDELRQRRRFLPVFSRSATHHQKGLPPVSRWRAISQFASWVVHPSRLRYIGHFIALQNSDDFDPDWYRRRYSDVAKARVSPLLHYIEHGRREARVPRDPSNPRALTRRGRPPSASFSRKMSHFGSWVRHRHFGFIATYFRLRRSDEFDLEFYLSRNTDVLAAGLDPLMHFVEHGRAEGRLGRPHSDGRAPSPAAPSSSGSRRLVLPVRRPDTSARRPSKAGSVVLYTAIAGGYDTLRPPAVTPPDVDFVCFLDDPRTQFDSVWHIRPFDFFHADPVRMARYAKLHPHLYFSEYEWSLWIDANLQLTADPRSLIEGVRENGAIGMYLHPHREHVYEEFEEILRREGLDLPDVVAEQMERYRHAGATANGPLFETGVMVRRHSSPEVIRLMNEWWRELENGSRRDQLSLPIAAHRVGVEPIPLAPRGISVRESTIFTRFAHEVSVSRALA